MDGHHPTSVPNTHTFYLFRNTAVDSKKTSCTIQENMRNQTKLVMQPFANWEEYLTPAPLSIAILGELVFISSKTDFSINKNPPKNGYQYIKYPESFRACLMEVCNSVWGTFNEVSKNMDRIWLHTISVPDYMKTAVKILFQGNDEVVQTHFPDQLKRIHLTANDCLVLAESAEEQLIDIQNLIQELLDACVNAEHFYTYNDVKSKRSSADEVDKIHIYSKSREILMCVGLIQQFVQKNDIDWKSLYDQKSKTPNTDFVKDQFIRINSTLEKFPECNAKIRPQMLCEDAIDICIELAIYAPDGKCEEAKTKQLINKIRKLTESARAFDSKSKDVTKSLSLAPKPPMMFKEESKSEKKSTSQRASENARFRIEQSRAQLNETRETYEKSVENMEKNQKELTEILISMKNCEIKEINFNTTIRMLVKGMDAMGRVKEQWEKMVRFFQMVSSIVKISLTRTLKDFVSISEKTQSLSYNSKLFSKDLLYNQAFQASNIASLVHMISATYTEVSEKYLMDHVSSLGKLMAMDKEKPEFLHERLQLQNSCDEAQRGILRLVLKNKQEFERKSDSRMEKIDKELLAILPKAAPEEMKTMHAAFENGFTEEEEAGYY